VECINKKRQSALIKQGKFIMGLPTVDRLGRPFTAKTIFWYLVIKGVSPAIAADGTAKIFWPF
jgi:hypothetical protein